MSRYTDIMATIQVIGGVYLQPSLLDKTEKYQFDEGDFTDNFHQILFGSIYNLHTLGTENITASMIDAYLEQRPKSHAVFKAHRGLEFLEDLADNIDLSAFDYYYGRVKKMTLLRAYNEYLGMDLSWLYDIDNIADFKKKQSQEEWLDSTSLEEITKIIDDKIEKIKLEMSLSSNDSSEQIGNDLLGLLENYKVSPDYGFPFYDDWVNTVTEGAKTGKMYIRSGVVNVGKTRSFIADACTFACDECYNINTRKWESLGPKEGTLLITTEQTYEEIQTMCLAFLAGVEEGHIRHSEYTPGEWERVMKAVRVLERAKLFVDIRPDYSLTDIENSVKYNIMEHDVRFICYDYLHSSMKILAEISSKTGVKGLREDQILFMLSVRLREIAAQYDVCVITSTQLNGSYTTTDTFDQNLLRGAKSIADKADWAAILLPTTEKDIESLKPILEEGGYQKPDIKMAIYKNRSNEYKGVILWGIKKLGMCRTHYMFMTSEQYEWMKVEKLKIKVNSALEDLK